MAGTGPAPKPGAIRRNVTEFTALVEDGITRGYELPEGVLPRGEEWHPMTRRWWEHWRVSPQASRMLSMPDWDYLLDTALIHHQMWFKGRWELAAEVRQRVANFGATPADRNRLRAEIQVAPTLREVPLATVSQINSQRDRMIFEED